MSLILTVVIVAALYGLALIMYGSLRSFAAAWKEWIGAIFSPAILTGGAFPPLRILYWLIAAAVLFWAAPRM